MSDSKPEPIPENILNHVKFFILFTVTFFLATNLNLIISRSFPNFYSPIVRIFDNLSVPIILMVYVITIGRIMLLVFPEFAISSKIKPYIVIIPALIMIHPLLISVAGSEFTTLWLVIDLINQNRFFELLVEQFIFAFVGYALFLIQSNSEGRTSRFNQILRYLGKEIYSILFIIILSIEILSSFAIENLESATLTNALKYLLVYLFYYFTTPIEEDKSSTELYIDYNKSTSEIEE